MTRPPKRDPSRREIALANRFFASAAPRPVELPVVKPKRVMNRGPSSEWHEQKAVIEWWQKQCWLWGVPVFALHAIPNGAHLAGGSVAAFHLKSTGLRPGIPDLCLAAPRGKYHAAYIELKYGENKESDQQIIVMSYLRESGYFVRTCWGADEAMAAIREYMTLP